MMVSTLCSIRHSLLLFIALSISGEVYAFYRTATPTLCRVKVNSTESNPNAECAEAKKAKKILPQLSANEQLVGVSTRDDRPNEIYALIVKTAEQGFLSEIIFQKYVTRDNKKDGELLPSPDATDRVSGSLKELNERGGFTIHKESGGVWPVVVTRKVLHLRAMSENEADSINYDPTRYDKGRYKDEVKKPTKDGPRIGRMTAEAGGRLWLSFAKNARGSEDSIWESGFDFYLTADVSKDPETGSESRRWKLSRDAQAQIPFDTIPLAVNKDGEDLNGVIASEPLQKIARVLSGEKDRTVASTPKESDRDSKSGASVLESPSTPSSAGSGGVLQSSNGQ
jgi:hypothetical protein